VAGGRGTAGSAPGATGRSYDIAETFQAATPPSTPQARRGETGNISGPPALSL
jgi:hypothetical protein